MWVVFGTIGIAVTMTPKELAEKIATELYVSVSAKGMAHIESLLTEAMDEAVMESRKADDRLMLDHRSLYEKDLKEAKAEAYEDAAKVAENHESDAPDPCDFVIRQIADAIRQRAEELK